MTLGNRPSLARSVRNDAYLYLLLSPAVIVTFIFCYLPLPGILLAFKDYDVLTGFFASPWVGLDNIKAIFQLPDISSSIVNTVVLSVLTLIISFPAPIVLAILLNELRVGVFKRVVQSVSYLPHFLSWIAVVGIASSFLSLYGPVNDLAARFFGGDDHRVLFLAKQDLFVPFVLIIRMWKEIGWSSIIYLAAITSINPGLYEAAKIDGASKLQQMLYITLPGLKTTAMMLLILQVGDLFGSSYFELVYALQNPFINYEIISTVVYKNGIQEAYYSLATAVGFAQGLVGFILTASANYLSKKVSDVSIW